MQIAQKIKNLTVSITDRCNGHCVYCSIPLHFKTEMSLHMIESMCDNAALKNVTELSITGGEPFLHPELCDILDCVCKRLPLKQLYLNTNLSMPISLIVEALKRIPSTIKCYLSVSCDGDEVVNKMTRGVSYHEKFLPLSLGCKEYLNVTVGLSMTLCKINCSYENMCVVHSIAEKYGWGFSMRPADISTLYYGNSGFQNVIADTQRSEIIRFIDEFPDPFLKKLKEFLLHGRILYAGKEQKCIGGQYFAFVQSDGTVYSCLYGNEKLGHVCGEIIPKSVNCTKRCCTDCVIWPMIEYYGE